jgi:hypothetical protein
MPPFTPGKDGKTAIVIAFAIHSQEVNDAKKLCGRHFDDLAHFAGADHFEMYSPE